MRVKDFNIFIAIEQECQHVSVAHILELFLLLLGCQTVGEKELNGGKQGGIVVKLPRISNTYESNHVTPFCQEVQQSAGLHPVL